MLHVWRRGRLGERHDGLAIQIVMVPTACRYGTRGAHTAASGGRHTDPITPDRMAAAATRAGSGTTSSFRVTFRMYVETNDPL